MSPCPCLVKHVQEFMVINRVVLPFDHAPISISMSNPGIHLENALARAEMLGDYAVLYGRNARCRVVKKKGLVTIHADVCCKYCMYGYS